MKAHEEEMKILRAKNQEMQEELEMLKVSVAYVQLSYTIIFGLPKDHLNVIFQPPVVLLA